MQYQLIMPKTCWRAAYLFLTAHRGTHSAPMCTVSKFHNGNANIIWNQCAALSKPWRWDVDTAWLHIGIIHVNTLELYWITSLLVLWILTKKHISALVYVAITFIMLFGVQQLERSCSVQGNAKDRYAISILQGPDVVARAPISIDFYNWYKWWLGYHATCFYHRTSITLI